jgi:hypothetical protein
VTLIERARDIAANHLDPAIAPGTVEAIRAGRMDKHIWVRIAKTALEQRVAQEADTPEGDWMPDTAIAQVESCGFECEAGPLELSKAWMWIKNTLLSLQEWTDEKTDDVPDGITRTVFGPDADWVHATRDRDQ